MGKTRGIDGNATSNLSFCYDAAFMAWEGGEEAVEGKRRRTLWKPPSHLEFC